MSCEMSERAAKRVQQSGMVAHSTQIEVNGGRREFEWKWVKSKKIDERKSNHRMKGPCLFSKKFLKNHN